MRIVNWRDRKLDDVSLSSVGAKVFFRRPTFQAVQAAAAAQDVFVVVVLNAQTAPATEDLLHLSSRTLKFIVIIK